MKKLDRDSLEVLENAARKRHLRSIRAGVRKRDDKKTRRRARGRRANVRWVKIHAPATLDLYSPKNYRATIKFIQDVVSCIGRRMPVDICFRNTKLITAAAGLLLVAETDRLTQHIPDARVKATRPSQQRIGKFKELDMRVESVLNQIGFFALIKQKQRVLPSYANVTCWKYESGLLAEGKIAASLIRNVEGRVPNSTTRAIYRGAIEAISNCVDHAYPARRDDGLQIDDKRWWMFVGVFSGKLVVLVCDLGVGIPNTLPQKHSKGVLRQVLSKLGLQGTTDGELIKAATYIKQTRTGNQHRGKGGKDLRSLLDLYPGSRLSIFSNHGRFVEKSLQSRKTGKITPMGHIRSDEKRSVRGTIIEWVLPLEEDLK